jgi:hypothetical protein
VKTVYSDPVKLRRRPNLIAGLISVPSTHQIQPFENQLTETLAWLVDRAPTFARRFVGLFLRPDDAEALGGLGQAEVIGASTQISLPALPGTGLPRPDLSVVGDARTFHLLVEVKVAAAFHDYVLGAETVSQTDAYLRAWRDGTAPAAEAHVRRVGTLSLADELTHLSDPWRAADVSWPELVDAVQEAIALDEFPTEAVAVAEDFADVLLQRVVPAAPHPDLDALLEWGRALLKLLRPHLAARIPHAAETGAIKRGKDSVSGHLLFSAPDGGEVRLWLGVTPRGGEYNAFGYDDSLWLSILSKVPDAWQDGLIGGGFERLLDRYGDNFFRVALPVEVIREGTEDSDGQAVAAEEWAYAAVVRAGLVIDPNEVGRQRWEAFGAGDLNAFWAFVYDPPPGLKFTWLPGDVEVIGMTTEEQLGKDGAALLAAVHAIGSRDDITSMRERIETFIRQHPGDATAVSAGLALVSAERGLKSSPGSNPSD